MKTITASSTLTKEQTSSISSALDKLSEGATKIYDRKKQKVYRFQAAGLDLIAKTYVMDTVSRKLSAALGFSRARRSYRAGLILQKAGLLTPSPLLLIEKGNPFPTSSILVTEFCEGTSLRDLVMNKEEVPSTVGDDLRAMLNRMKQIKVRHGDLHADNVIIASDGKPHLIDLDSTRRRILPKTVEKNIRDDRDRLVKSLKFDPEFQASLISAIGGPGQALPES